MFKKFGVGKVFWKNTPPGCIYLIKNTIKTVILWDIINKCNLIIIIITVMQNLICNIITPVFSVTWSLRN